MKHMHIRYAALLLFALLSASVSSFAQTVLEQKISAISAIKKSAHWKLLSFQKNT